VNHEARLSAQLGTTEINLIGPFNNPWALFQLFYAESNLALMWGGLLLTFISLYLTVRVASLRLTE